MVLKSLAQIESVTAEILLIWTNVAVTYVDWTNVTVMVVSVKDGPRILPFTFGQNWVSNS